MRNRISYTEELKLLTMSLALFCSQRVKKIKLVAAAAMNLFTL